MGSQEAFRSTRLIHWIYSPRIISSRDFRCTGRSWKYSKAVAIVEKAEKAERKVEKAEKELILKNEVCYMKSYD
ncbi:MAG: hypothetical protein D3926_14825 [Desulfobacteraceae bacterium]|nr:MAG: hypothetical protein D3926_14825 [Desulfobacteraceae bacterium]